MTQPRERTVLELPLPGRSAVAMALLLGVPLLVAWRCPGVLAPFLLSGVLAYLLNPLVVAIQHVMQRIPVRLTSRLGLSSAGTRAAAVSLFFLWLVTVVALFGFPLIVSAASNLYALADAVGSRSPAEYQVLVRQVALEYKAKLEGIPLVRESLEKLTADSNTLGAMGTVADSLARFLGRQLQALASLAIGVFAAGASLAVVPLLLFYMLADWDRLLGAVARAIPDDYQDWFEDFMGRLDRALGGYIRAQLLICLIYGFVMTLGLALIGIPYATLLGPLAGAACFVPYLGAALGVGAAACIALVRWGFTIDAAGALGGLAILFMCVQALDGLVLQPRIMGGHVGLHPIAILFALALGQDLAGLYGLLLALPAAALLKVLLADVQRVLYRPPEPAAT
ncbi:MAG: AI-2E family transporter [Candidatus Wallbacteria bacterium]|nr:AI-2E family transporter [Candidatus Wallbacteria bacterium]